MTIFFLLSFYWTNQVLGNVVQATVAGAVGTWWFDPEEARGYCSPALTGSLFRSVSYSFGSICFGSLIVAVIQTLRALLENVAQNSRNRGNDDGGCGGELLLCLAQCLLQLLEQAAEYFNKWAFIYVGLYGYSYLEAGQTVLTLFRERGWSAVISDQLTARVLGMMGFAIGLGTALLAALIAGLVSLSSGGSSQSIVYQGTSGLITSIAGSVVLALIIGMALASIMFGVVNSGVDTIIVLFAEAPYEFQENHPQLSMEMHDAWRDAWPEMFLPFSEPTTTVVV
jgi:hypothetical protein